MLLARELPQVVVPGDFLPLDLDSARINVEKAAYHGFAKAQVKMGAAYELCQLGCDFNPALSLHYNALAARQGEPDAEMAISKWFLCGHEGVFEKNDEMAYTYAKRAAQSGMATAEFALGYFHEIGIYVPVDIKEARSWYSKAAADGNKDASSRIDSISRSKTLSRKDHERVAITRIKSQYASHGRQSRIAEAQSVQPIQENLEMPDPSRMSLADPAGQRPMSAAPYPDGPNSGYPPMSASGQYGGEMVPSSAFGINPNIRSQSANPAGRMGNRAVSGPNPQGYQRPPSSGVGMGPPPLIPPYGSPQSSHGSPKLDIGFSAPPDPSGADRRKKLQRPGAPGTPSSAAGARVPSSPRSTTDPHSRPGTADSKSKASRADAKPQKAATAPSAAGGGSAAAAASQKPVGGLPGKGPKTFDEMGVPHVKSNGDCVSFYLLFFIGACMTNELTGYCRLLCDEFSPSSPFI